MLVKLTTGDLVKVARRGDQPALTKDKKYVLGCFPGEPKYLLLIPVEQLPF